MKISLKQIRPSKGIQRVTRLGIQVNGEYYWNLLLAQHYGETVVTIIVGNVLWVKAVDGKLLAKFILNGFCQPHCLQ